MLNRQAVIYATKTASGDSVIAVQRLNRATFHSCATLSLASAVRLNQFMSHHHASVSRSYDPQMDRFMPMHSYYAQP